MGRANRDESAEQLNGSCFNKSLGPPRPRRFTQYEAEAPPSSREGSGIPLTARTGLARRLHRLGFAARSAAHGP